MNYGTMSRLSRSLLILSLALLVLLAASGCGADTEREPVTVTMLIDDYEKYKGNTVLITGKVGNVQDILGGSGDIEKGFVYLQPLSGFRPYYAVHCWFRGRDANQFRGLRKGQTVTLKGRYKDYGYADNCTNPNI